jgi:hypothetical protein
MHEKIVVRMNCQRKAKGLRKRGKNITSNRSVYGPAYLIHFMALIRLEMMAIDFKMRFKLDMGKPMCRKHVGVPSINALNTAGECAIVE